MKDKQCQNWFAKFKLTNIWHELQISTNGETTIINYSVYFQSLRTKILLTFLRNNIESINSTMAHDLQVTPEHWQLIFIYTIKVYEITQWLVAKTNWCLARATILFSYVQWREGIDFNSYIVLVYMYVYLSSVFLSVLAYPYFARAP